MAASVIAQQGTTAWDLLTRKGTRVFVASGWVQRFDAKKLMDELTARGLIVTCDWTKESTLEMAEKAKRDGRAVFDAQVLVAMMTIPDYDYKGTNFELGVAYGREIPIVLISPFHARNDATCARNVHFHHEGWTRIDSMTMFLAKLPPPSVNA